MEFLLIFGETNFVKSQESVRSVKFTAHKNRVPYSNALWSQQFTCTHALTHIKYSI